MIIKPYRGTQLNHAHPLARGLVGCWLFNEGTGNKVSDLSLNDNNGTLTNMNPTTDWVGGKDGVALDFDGVDDCVTIPNSPTINPNYITVGACVKTSQGGLLDQIFTKDADTDTLGRIWQFRKDSTDVINFIPFNAATNGNELGTTNIADGIWHFVVGTWDGVAVRVYVDGREDGIGSTLIGPLRTGPNNAFIGRSENKDPGYWAGQIDFPFLYNRALSASEVLQLYINPYAMFDSGISPAIFVSLGISAKTVNLDALIKKTISNSVSIDSYIQKTVPVTLSVDSLLNKILSQNVPIDALLQGAYQKTISIDALINKFGISSSLSIDSLINKAGLTEQLSIDAILISTGVPMVSIDALIQKYGVVFDVSLDAIIQKAEALNVNLDALTQKEGYSYVVIDALLLKQISNDLYLDALTQKEHILTVSLDAYIEQLININTGLDALLKRAKELDVGLDALINQADITKIVSLDALILKGYIRLVSMDSIVYETLGKQVDFDALLSGGKITSTLLDAIIYSALVSATSRYTFLVSSRDDAFDVGSRNLTFTV